MESTSEPTLDETPTGKWEEALVPANDLTHRMCCELSGTSLKLYCPLTELRTHVVLYIGAAYELLNQGSRITFLHPLKFRFGNYYSNHYVYGVTQWTVWWAWRAWMQAVFFLSQVCVAESFPFIEGRTEMYTITRGLSIMSCVQHLFHSSCCLANVIQDFLPKWPSLIWDTVLPDDDHARFDVPAVTHLMHANAAMCQLLGLILSDDYSRPWNHTQAERAVKNVIIPYHEVHRVLHDIETKIDRRLIHVPVVSTMALNLYNRSLARYAKSYCQFDMELWAWRRTSLHIRDVPLLTADADARTECLDCRHKCEQHALPAFEPDTHFLQRMEARTSGAFHSLHLSLVHSIPIDRDKFPVFSFY